MNATSAPTMPAGSHPGSRKPQPSLWRNARSLGPEVTPPARLEGTTGVPVGLHRPWRKHRVVKVVRAVGFYVLLLMLFFPFFFVFAWMIEGAFKNQIQNTAIPPLFVFKPTLENFQTVFSRNPMGRFLLNSVVVGCGATLLALVFGLPAAYGIARYKHKRLPVAILVARIMPGISFLVPWFIMFSKVKLIGSYFALTLAHLLITLPMTIWLMIGFFEDIPKELDEAAFIDGCNPLQAFFRVSLPLTISDTSTSVI